MVCHGPGHGLPCLVVRVKVLEEEPKFRGSGAGLEGLVQLQLRYKQ